MELLETGSRALALGCALGVTIVEGRVGWADGGEDGISIDAVVV